MLWVVILNCIYSRSDCCKNYKVVQQMELHLIWYLNIATGLGVPTCVVRSVCVWSLKDVTACCIEQVSIYIHVGSCILSHASCSEDQTSFDLKAASVHWLCSSFGTLTGRASALLFSRESIPAWKTCKHIWTPTHTVHLPISKKTASLKIWSNAVSRVLNDKKINFGDEEGPWGPGSAPEEAKGRGDWCSYKCNIADQVKGSH